MLSLLRVKDKVFYGWVVVATFFIIGTAIWGVRLSYGVFFKSIESEFGLNRAATSSVFSIYMVLGGIFTILVGWALDRYGPRIIILLMGLFTGLSLLLTSQTQSLWQVFIAYSLLLSIGSSAVYVVVMSTVSRWFDKKRGMALGIASSGGGLGTVIMAPFAAYLISSFDWRMAYIVIGLIIWAVVMPLSRLLKRDPYEIGALPDGVKADSADIRLQKPENKEDSVQSSGLSLLQASRTRSFWLVMLIWLFYASSFFLLTTHLVPHVTDIGFSALQGASVLSMMGAVAIAGRIIIGTVSDRIGRKVTVIICNLIQASVMIWLVWIHDLWMFYLFAAMLGLAWGCLTPSMAALISDTFGLDKIGAIMGVLDVGFGVGAAIGPAIGGLIFDITGSYFWAFLFGAVAMFIVAIFTYFIRQETVS